MEALTGEHGSHESSFEIICKYFNISLIKHRDRTTFSKLQVLSNPSLLFKVSKLLSVQIHPDITHLCLLASSGMAMGVALSLDAKLPLIFYRRLQWPKPEADGLGPKFMPDVPLTSNIGIVDSHDRTRYTSALCYDELLLERKINVSQVLAPISFDMCIDPNNNRNMSYSYLSSATEIIGSGNNFDAIGLDKESLLQLINEPGFWLYPPYEDDQDPYKEFRAPGFRKLPRWFIGKGADFSIFNKIGGSISSLADWIAADDDGIWKFFSSPLYVEEFSIEAGKLLNLKQYDYLVGVGHLGTALSIALAYHNRSEFSGSILFYLGGHGLIPKPSELNGKKVLPVEMRVTTGVYAVDIFNLVKKLNGSVNEYLTVFLPTKPKGPSVLDNIIMSSRQTSLNKLNEYGVKFIYFFDK